MFNLFRATPFTIGLQHGNLLAEGISEQSGYDMGTIYIIMCIVLLALGLAGLLTGTEPHVEFLGALTAESLLQVVGDLVGIDEMAVHTTGHIAGSHTIEAVGIDERVALHQVFTPSLKMVLRNCSSSATSGGIMKKLRRTTAFISTGIPPSLASHGHNGPDYSRRWSQDRYDGRAAPFHRYGQTG